MKRLVEFVWTTIVGGFLVVLPVALAVFLVVQAVGFLLAFTEPLAAQLPVDEVGGLEMALLLAVAIVFGACFLAGLVARTRIGARSSGLLERLVLNRLPGYSLIKSLTRRFAGSEEGSRFAPALACLTETGVWELVFVVDEHAEDAYTVFQPIAPTPTAGFIHFVAKERVRPLDAPMGAVMNCVMQWGIGSKEIFRTADPR